MTLSIKDSSTTSTSPSAVLLISFGGPEKSEDVMPFLEIVTRGRGIPRERLEEVAHHYEELGGKSPINEITRQQANALRSALSTQDSALAVYIGQRNWNPFLEDTLREMAKAGIKRAIGFSTGPHRSEASLERYVMATEKARAAVGPAAPVIDYVAPWFDHPLFIEAIAARVRETLESHPELQEAPWHFVAHSIPCKMAKESTYVEELRTTAELVARHFGKKEWTLAYSSRSGNPREPWLEPDVCDAIRANARQGAKAVFLITIGFIADHVEVLYDQDIEAKAAADEAGIAFYRSKTVGDHPAFIAMIADVIQKRMQNSQCPQETSSATTRFLDGRSQSCEGALSSTCFCRPGDPTPRCVEWVRLLKPTALKS